MAWYPHRNRYYVETELAQEIEQGDVFWGVPSLSAVHPAVADHFTPRGKAISPEDLKLPSLTEVLRGIRVRSEPVIVMPHTCDFYALEKGRSHPDRLVARIDFINQSRIQDPASLRSGGGYFYTFFLPSWLDPNDAEQDGFVNFRQMTTIDASYLNRKQRVARLSDSARIALRRRLAHFFTDYAPSPRELAEADQRNGLIRDGSSLIAVERLRAILGDQETDDLLRRMFDPRL